MGVNLVARGFIPVGPRSGPSVLLDRLSCLDLRLLRSRTGMNPLATGDRDVV